jgi:RHS repeat-associated protein
MNAAGGVLTSGASAIENRFLFTGREYNSDFGFYEYRARAYHPGLGRFMSEDPKLFDAGDYNFYRYCNNDPWDLTDPTGLIWNQMPSSAFVSLVVDGVGTVGAARSPGASSVTITGQNIPLGRQGLSSPPMADFENSPRATEEENASSALKVLKAGPDYREIGFTLGGRLVKSGLLSKEKITLDLKATTIPLEKLRYVTSERHFQWYASGVIHDSLKAKSNYDATGHVRLYQKYDVWLNGRIYQPGTKFQHDHELLHGVPVGNPGFRQVE